MSKLTERQRQEILERYRIGDTVESIAEAFDVSYEYILILAGRRGVRRSRLETRWLVALRNIGLR